MVPCWLFTNFNILEIVDRLSFDSDYQDLSLEAYDRELDYFVLLSDCFFLRGCL